MSTPKEIWETIFGKKEYAFDFTNQIIIKDEYKTGKEYSWDIDKYDSDHDDFYIANEVVIKSRNQQPIFEFKGNKYVSVKNEDHTFSMISLNKILDNTNPMNYDLVLANKIANYKNSNYVVLSIAYMKMLNSIDNIFISFIVESIKNNIDFEYIKFDNSNILKNKISFLIDKSKCDTKKVVDFSMILKTLMQLFILRTKEKFEEIWMNENTGFDFCFNIFVFSSNEIENIFQLNERNFISYVESFEERILLNKNVKEELEQLGMLSHDFQKLYVINDIDIYSYNYLNSTFNSFYLNQKNKK